MTWTHVSAGVNGSSTSTVSVALSPVINSGDLVTAIMVAGALPIMSDSASVVTTWHVIAVDAANNAYAAWGIAASASPSGTTVTGNGTGGGVMHFISADVFRPSGAVTVGTTATTGSSGVPGLNLNTNGCGDLGTVPAGALAYGAFWSGNTVGDQAYTAGFQTGTTPPADVIGAQMAGANGTGVSMYVLNCANEDATLTWFGTGTAQFGRATSIYFTTTTPAVPVVQGGGVSMFKRSLLWADL